MATKIVTKNSSTASAVPTASDLVQGELAVNVADKRLFTEDNGGAIVELGTNPSTLTVAGEITANGGIALGDNDKATFGASDDLQIYHDGTSSYVEDAGSGNLILKTNGANIQFRDTSDNIIFKASPNATTLYYAAAEKLNTNPTGIDVTGTATMDGLTVEGSQVLVASVNNSSTTAGTGGLKVNTASDSSATVPFYVRSNNLNRLRVKGNGDFELFEDTGTTAKFFWDASAESLGIGTSSPSAKLELSSNNSAGTALNVLRFNDEDGTQAPNQPTGRIEFYHNDSSAGAGVASSITNISQGSTALGELVFATGSDTERLRIDSSGNVGIGTSSPTESLAIHSSANAQIRLQPSATGTSGFINTTSGSTKGMVQYNHNSDYMRIYTNGSERLRIDASGRVGIGTTSPACHFHVKGSGNGSVSDHLRISSTDTQAKLAFTNTTGNGAIYQDGQNLVFANNTANVERMRIDSSGNLLVGKTANNNSAVGVSIRPNEVSAVRDGGNPLLLNRLTSDGDIAVFRKDGANVGSIGSLSNHLHIGNGDTALRFIDSLKAICPLALSTSSDAVLDLGRTAERFKDLHLSGGVYLGGTGAANKLDDYEEGTWTPSVSNGTVSNIEGKYTKVGRAVTITAIVGGFSDATTSTAISIQGLPFIANGDASSGIMFQHVNASKADSGCSVYIANNASTIKVFGNRGGTGWVQLNNSDLTSTGAYFRFSITYFTD